VHGDFQIQNVIVSPPDGAVRAVLDWELCALGDPLADLGGLLAYWPQPDDPGQSILPAPALPGFLSRDELARAYAQRSGHSLELLGFWHALGLWKLAIIGEGVLRRELQAPSSRASSECRSRRLIDDLITRACRVADAAGL
jgi:aminoglycoside phosphotransferase (APT) family kinase protein